MSYNIDTFKVKKLKLILPKGFSMVDLEKKNRGSSWHDEIVIRPDGYWSFNEGGDGFSLVGHMEKSGDMVVDEVQCVGEGSGHDYEDLLKPLFQGCGGEIHCVTVWEGGDWILDLRIKAGEVRETDVEL